MLSRAVDRAGWFAAGVVVGAFAVAAGTAQGIISELMRRERTRVPRLGDPAAN